MEHMQVTKMKSWYINNTERPLIFLGTSTSMLKYAEPAEAVGIQVAGIIDSDYHGNTEEYCGMPIIDSDDAFSDPEKLKYYRENFNFFIAVNWTPENRTWAIRNNEKRKRYMNMIEQLGLNCISIVDPTARLSKHSSIGYGVFLDGHVLIEPKTSVGNFTVVWYNNSIGHDNVIGNNCVFQRQVILASDNVIEDNVYFGTAVKALKNNVTFGRNSFIHEGIYIRRGTLPDEVVSTTSPNQRRVYHHFID